MNNKNLDFKFYRNWKSFLKWYDTYATKVGNVPDWDLQTDKIQECFSSTARGIVNWKLVWNDLASWYKVIYAKKKDVTWDEQRRQIETLMLGQLNNLGKEQFVLVYLNRGIPEMDTNKMTYWEAVRVKESLAGDKNGNGGNEDMDKITIVNLELLIQ